MLALVSVHPSRLGVGRCCGMILVGMSRGCEGCVHACGQGLHGSPIRQEIIVKVDECEDE